MLKVKIDSITGFGKTAEFATVHLMHYDLASGGASATVNLYENDPTPGSPTMPAVQIMTNHITCTPEDTATWGTTSVGAEVVRGSNLGLARSVQLLFTGPAGKKWGLDRSGKGSCGIQCPECQELSESTAAAPLITLNHSETQNVDLANRVRGNHYLRHVDHRSTHI